jgi:hypothetical protein
MRNNTGKKLNQTINSYQFIIGSDKVRYIRIA